MYNRGDRRLAPRMGEERDALSSNLAAQGFTQDDEGYKTAMRRFNERYDDQYADLADRSILTGGTEATRQFDMGMGRRQQDIGEINTQGAFANQASQQALAQQLGIGGAKFNEGKESSMYDNMLRNQDITEEAQKRGWSLDDVNNLLTGTGVNMPGQAGFNQANQAQGADLMGAANNEYSAAQNKQASKNAYNQQMMQGLMSMGMMMFSDRRLKRNIEKIGELVSGLPVYVFEYIWGERSVGVMAQECAILFPNAVHQHESGYLMVDYGEIK